MAVLAHFDEPVRTMAWLDALTGPRGSELFGLQWADIDFEAATLQIRRGIVYGVAGATKSEASRSRLPIAKPVLDSLLRWRSETPYAAPNDWVFASPQTKGKRPYWGNTLVRRHLRVAAGKAGISGSVGAHTFRRSLSTWLIDNDENVNVVQELARHANSNTTLDAYARAVTAS